MGVELDPEERREVFGDEDPNRHAAEARERWGDTDAYRESERRTSRYAKHDWQRLRDEGEDVERRFAAAMAEGRPAAGAEAMDLAEEHRAQISRWFYDCGYDIHRGLAELYVADPRFTAHYDRRAQGLARYVHDAILANADRAAS